MSSLYRCKARVAYRPFRSNQLIVFEEKQIQELDIKLKWQPNLGVANADRSTPASAFTNALSQSKCSVTISDPYLTGLAWPALYDAAAIYTASTNAAANNILLPACKEGQDPVVDKCYKFEDLSTDGLPSDSALDNFAFLLVSLWYDVKGTSFGTDFYFRVDGLSISHGSKYPAVTIRGIEARSILFNQSLVNLGFDENLPVDEALKKVAEDLGYEVNFCANPKSPEAPPEEGIKRLPRTFRLKGVTHGEAMSRLINATGGNMLSLPLREYANKISICTRAEVNQGCSVFYLGRGLYESYEISAQPELNMLLKNRDFGGTINEADPYSSEIPKASAYTLEDVVPRKRQEALRNVRKVPFPQLFTDCKPRCTGKDFSGYVWKGPGPNVINEELKGFNLRGIAPTGQSAISFLDGTIEEASSEFGRILIKTNYYLRLKVSGEDKVFTTPILQESTNLSTVKVKIRDKTVISQEIGSSTAEKPEFTRFFIRGHSKELITIAPEIVWGFAIPTKEVPPPANNAPTSTPAPTTPPPSTTAPVIIGKVGSTGSSSGPHLHAEWADRRPITAEQVRKYVKVPGVITSPYDDPTRTRHKGVDIGGNDRAPLELINGASVASVGESTCTAENVRSNRCGGGFGNFVRINTPEGQMILAHLAPGSIPPNIAGMRASSSGGNTRLGLQGAPASQGLMVETGFKGVPRALRIIPGRTVLSFVTDYDAWIEGGRKVDSTDPGVWIASRFKNWFISECSYKWREGDLRIQIEGVSAWGTRQIQVPTFANYMRQQKGARAEINLSSDFTNTYYDYIRAPGGLSWQTESGQDSTEVYCAEAQELSAFLAAGADSAAGTSTPGGTPSDVQSGYPTAKCQYTGTRYSSSRVNAIINAARAGGINTKAGFAGVVGNALVESTTALSPTAENPTSKAYGIFQWLGVRRTGLENYARSGGKSASDFNTQMGWFVEELKGADFQGPATVSSLNRQTDPSQAAFEFNRLYERAPGQKEAERQQFAQEIFNNLSCS